MVAPFLFAKKNPTASPIKRTSVLPLTFPASGKPRSDGNGALCNFLESKIGQSLTAKTRGDLTAGAAWTLCITYPNSRRECEKPNRDKHAFHPDSDRWPLELTALRDPA